MINKDETTNKITISTCKVKNLYFSVGISNSTNKIVRISLPNSEKKVSINEISNLYPEFEESDKHLDTAKTISRIFHGEKVYFNLKQLDMEFNGSDSKNSTLKTRFCRDVLVETIKIPYGEVITYKGLAEKLQTRAYRAVGTALGKNPFPIVIPCHRVIKSNMMIGEYGGGRDMKKEILLNEGVKIKGERIVN